MSTEENTHLPNPQWKSEMKLMNTPGRDKRNSKIPGKCNTKQQNPFLNENWTRTTANDVHVFADG